MSALLKIDDKEIRKIVSDLRFYERRKRKEVVEELRIGAKVIEGNAKEFAPVDTGTLISMIQVAKEENDGLTQIIESKAEYSEYVEFGTSRMMAQPFMWPAFAAERLTILRNLQKIMDRK